MSLVLRIVLIVVSILILAYVVNKVKKSKFNIVDSIFWIVLSAIFLFFAVFPQIAGALAGLLGIQTPINFILLFVLAMLFIKVFLQSIRISQQDEKIKELAQKAGIDEFERQLSKEDKGRD